MGKKRKRDGSTDGKLTRKRRKLADGSVQAIEGVRTYSAICPHYSLYYAFPDYYFFLFGRYPPPAIASFLSMPCGNFYMTSCLDCLELAEQGGSISYFFMPLFQATNPAEIKNNQQHNTSTMGAQRKVELSVSRKQRAPVLPLNEFMGGGTETAVREVRGKVENFSRESLGFFNRHAEEVGDVVHESATHHGFSGEDTFVDSLLNLALFK